MKVVKKKLDFNTESISYNNGIWTYKISTNKHVDALTFDIFYEEEEPETIVEFMEEKNISIKELVSWLNKNYKE